MIHWKRRLELLECKPLKDISGLTYQELEYYSMNNIYKVIDSLSIIHSKKLNKQN